ncbi:CoxG family protein [Tengunoibacter tsumagoiensis]|nr:SRPBCC domain-containing protein [Tengunoibacter tsumagoiensis]
MKLSGTHKFKGATCAQVFRTVLNPEVLKASIPGSNSVAYSSPTSLRVEISPSIPGLRGPYSVDINIVRAQEPNFLELQVARQGRGGSINATAQITLTAEADGTQLSYEGNADLDGTIAMLNNPLGQGAVKSGLNSFFNNIEKHIA